MNDQSWVRCSIIESEITTLWKTFIMHQSNMERSVGWGGCFRSCVMMALILWWHAQTKSSTFLFFLVWTTMQWPRFCPTIDLKNACKHFSDKMLLAVSKRIPAGGRVWEPNGGRKKQFMQCCCLIGREKQVHSMDLAWLLERDKGMAPWRAAFACPMWGRARSRGKGGSLTQEILKSWMIRLKKVIILQISLRKFNYN